MTTNRLIIAICLVTISMSGFAQHSALDQFFHSHQNDTAFTIVNISPKMFQMISRINIEEDSNGEISELIKGITGLRILVKDQGDGTKLYNDAFSKISKNGFEELLSVRDKGENIRFLVKEGSSADIISQLVLLVGGVDDFVLLDLTGNINLKTIGKLSKSLDVPGMEHLEKLEKH
jgi:hypothetical protein